MLLNTPQPFKSRLLMGPIERYKHYGIFPWAFLINILLVILSSSQLMNHQH